MLVLLCRTLRIDRLERVGRYGLPLFEKGACHSSQARRLLHLLPWSCSGSHLDHRASHCLSQCHSGAISSHLVDVSKDGHFRRDRRQTFCHVSESCIDSTLGSDGMRSRWKLGIQCQSDRVLVRSVKQDDREVFVHVVGHESSREKYIEL